VRKPGDFAKYATASYPELSKEAITKQIAGAARQLGRSFLKGVSGKGGSEGVRAGGRRLLIAGSRVARKAGKAADWAMKNPIKTTAGVAGAGYVASRALGGGNRGGFYR
jgi:hypothetical protein